MKLKKFQEFINEARHWSEEPYLYERYAKDLTTFGFENGVSDLIYEVEQAWTDIKNSYWWNREDWKPDHFALDVKIHVYPDYDEIREKFEKTEDEWSDDWLDGQWWRFMEDQREMYEEDIN